MSIEQKKITVTVMIGRAGEICWRCDYFKIERCDLFRKRLYNGRRCPACIWAEREAKQGKMFPNLAGRPLNGFKGDKK